ncbi:MAG TPA: zf-HC2 domain-containing protein [Planctomycetota bacterium]|nr:zf-HC2 domain-containing protein [Planctomycetota bacterium]
MNLRSDCDALLENLSPYVENLLDGDERRSIEAHLRGCASCRTAVNQFKSLHTALEEASSLEKGEFEAAFLNDDNSPGWRLSAAPWWGVSLVLHGLVILLAGLISVAISLPPAEEAMVTVTELAQRPQIEQAVKQHDKSTDPLHSKEETPPTDPTSKEACDVVVPPELLAKAELGDHFETINPDRPDTQSAFGNPDAKMFHSQTGSDDAAGGGGVGGTQLDDVIGVGGASSPGTGGGWGGGNGTGIGNGNGSGRGSFGNRGGGGRKLMVKRHGGSQASENAVDAALRWLAYHQEPDGHWDTKKYSAEQNVDAGITGLALLAFLGAGHTEKVGAYKDNVRRAVQWIISQQEQDGSIGKKYKEYWHVGYAYHHAICGLALAEAAGMARVPATMAAAQKAVDYTTEIHQRGEGSEKRAWRYRPNTEKPDAPEADASASGWFVMQLKSAKVAGLKVNHMSLDGALKYFDSIEVKTEVNGYKGGRFPYHKGLQPQLNPTAIGMLSNLFLGRKPSELHGGAEYLCQNLPDWNPKLADGVNGRTFPMYYTYYGTLTMFQIGGDHWKKWNTAMQNMLIPKQRKDGDEAGSWDPMGGADDKMSGRVYMTAMGALCLEVYYRYQVLNGNQ